MDPPPNTEPEPKPTEIGDQLPTPTSTSASLPTQGQEKMSGSGIEEEVELPVLTGGMSVGEEKGHGEEASGKGVQKRERIEIPDSDEVYLEEVELSPGRRDGGEGNESGEVRVEREEKEVVRGGDDKENPKEEKESSKGGLGISETVRSTEDEEKIVVGTRTEATPTQEVVEEQEQSNKGGVTTSQSLPTAQDKAEDSNEMDSAMQVDHSPVVSEPQATNGDDHISTSTAMAEKTPQISTGNIEKPSNEPQVPESTSEKEDVIMTDENSTPAEETEVAEAPISETHSTNQQQPAPVLSLSTELAQSRSRAIIPDSDEEDELSSTRTSPVKEQQKTTSKDIDIADALEIAALPPKNLEATTANPLPSPQKAAITPLQSADTPTKPTTTINLFSSPTLVPPPIQKRKLPPPFTKPPASSITTSTPLSNDNNVLRTELKAIKLASLTSRNASLVAEIAAKKSLLQEVTGKLEGPAQETVKRHIRLLHEYNDVRDVGQGLLGLVADNRGVRVRELYEEFGVGAKD